MNNHPKAVGIILIALLASACAWPNNAPLRQETASSPPTGHRYEQEARAKIQTLRTMMSKARAQNIDVAREETALWFAEKFLTFANWDQANPQAIEALFGYERYYKKDKKQLAEALPDFERQKVIQVLDQTIATLDQELSGEIQRRPVRKMDWQNTRAADNMFVSRGKPAFPYDYFSKTVGQPLTNTEIYNDHLGAIYHGGENLYPVDHDRAINSFLLKQDGTFDTELMKELTGIPDTNIGFLIYWLMGIPEWVEDQEPEVRKGRSLFTGFDIDNPLAREVWGKIIRRTGELTRGKKVTELGYILANEPHWFAEEGHSFHAFQEMNAISSYTLDKFRAWLSDKYRGDITALNENWGSGFAGFQEVQVQIPISKDLRGQPIWFDWCRYSMDRSTAWFKFMQDHLHAVNPEADTHVKIWPRAFVEDWRSHGIDTEALTELTTMIGHDAKSLGGANIRGRPSPWLEKYPYDWLSMGVFHDFLESVAPDKINVNSESHFLSSGQWRDLNARTSYVRSVYWLATLQGMDANMGWFWARDPDGSPEDRLEGELDFFDPGLAGAYAGSVNMQPHIANEVTQVMYDLNSFSEEIIALREQRRPVRLFYSETSAINTADYMTQTKRLYEAFFFEGFPLGFVTQNIIEKQSPDAWDVVVVDGSSHVTDAEFDALQSYLDQGGSVVLASPDNLALDEYGKPRERKLVAGKGNLTVLEAGATLKDITQAVLAKVQDRSMPAVVLTDTNGPPLPTTAWRVVDKPGGDGHLVNVFNLGHNTARLRLSLRAGGPVTITNMMTGNRIAPPFELPSEGVLLLEVTPGP